MSIVTTTGSLVGGGGLPTGMLRLTLCSWIGMVMISMMISTSITSISGVVLMSIMTSGSPPPPLPTFIAMSSTLRRRFGHEADLLDRGTRALEEHAADRLVARLFVAADVHLGLRVRVRCLAQRWDQRLAVGHELHVPEDVAVLVDRDVDVLRLRLPGDVGLLRQRSRGRVGTDRDRDQEDDEQPQHRVEERRGVDRRDDSVLVAVRGADGHGH